MDRERPAEALELTVGAIVRRGFRAWAENLGKVSLTLLLMLLPVLLALFFSFFGVAAWFATSDPGAVRARFLAVLVSVFLVGGVSSAVGFGALVFGTVRWLSGKPVGLGEMLWRGLQTLVPVALTAILVALGTLAGWVVLFVPGVIVAVATALALPAAVVERLGPIQAIRRGLFLSRGHRWTIFGCLAVLLVLEVGLSLLSSGVQRELPLLGFPTSLVILLVGYPLPWVVLAVAYHDVRAAKEGVDTSRLVEVFE